MIIQWIQDNTAESIAILISIISVAISATLGKREKPNVMPYGQALLNPNHLTLDFLNTSEFTIHDLTILINGFNSDYDELEEIDFRDKYLFSIGGKTTFNYAFSLGDYSKNAFYFRVRFKGTYNSRFPVFSSRKIEQSIWYSVIPFADDGNGNIESKISTTHKDDIEKIEAKHATSLKNYEKIIDKKFS